MANINISQILIKRGNTAAAGNYIGPLGELVVDTGLKTVRIQDGVTAGGMAVLATLSGYNQLSGNIANLQTTTANISANLSAFQTYANTTTANLSANLSAFQTYANATFGTSNFGNANVAAYLTTNPQGGQYSNANVASYLTASNIITGINANVTAANLQITNLWSNAGVQADAIAGANAAIITANTALKGYVDTQLSTLTNGASTALDTLLEIGTALGNNANFSATMITWLGNVTANTTAANTAIDTLQANLGGYYTWANANVAGLYGSITAANTAWQANAGVQADAIASLISNAAVQSANIATLVANAGVQADAITSLTANAGVQSANIATLFANAGVQADAIAGANAAIITANTAVTNYVDTRLSTLTNGASTALDTLLEIGTSLGNNANFSGVMVTWLGNLTANITAANTNISTLQANVGSYYTWANANVAGLSTSISNLQSNAGVQADAITSLQANITAANLAIAAASGTYSNTNVAAYLSASTTGNVGAGNLTVVNNFNSNIISANSFTYANGVSILAGIGGTYSNVDVSAYLSNYDGGINFTTSPAVITGLGNISSANFTFANGVNILSTVTASSSYSNSNVASYLALGTDATIVGLVGNTTASNAAIVTANTAMKSYVDAGNTTMTSYVGNQVTTANTAMKGYVDAVSTAWTAADTIQSNQIAGANAAIVTANSAVVSYVNTLTNSLATGANANTLAYLNSGFTVSGNITAGNISNVNIISANSLQLTNNLTSTGNITISGNITTPGLAVTTYANITAPLVLTNNTGVDSLQIIGTAGRGGAGYHDFLQATNLGGGTNINKWFRLDSTGQYQIINSAYSTNIFNLTDAGQLTVPSMVVSGNLQVQGTTTTVNQSTLSVSSSTIFVSVGSTTNTQANGAGVSVAGSNANLYYTSIGDQWNSNKPFYAPGIYDGAARVVSTSSGAGNLTISGTGVNLTSVGPGAVTTGSATAIPVITTDAYGRISGITTAAVSSTLNTAGNTGTGTVSLTSQSLSIGGTNGLTATASGQTITLTDNNWTWANANVSGLYNSILGANAATITANSALKSYTDNQITTANTALKGYVDAGNTTMTSYVGNQVTTANTAMKSYVDAGNTTQSNQINSINANIGGYYTWANANVAGLQSSITSLATNANTNTAAYLAAGISTNVTTTGNVSAGNVIATNIIVNGQQTNYGVVTPAYMVVGQSTDIGSVGNGSTFLLNTVVGNVNSQTSYNSSTGVFTLTAGVTYDMSFTPSFITFTNSTGGYLIYQWVDATTNTPLDSSGTGNGTAIPTTDTTGQIDNATARVIYTPLTNQTVKLRVTAGAGTATLRGGLGTQAVIKPLNPTIAVTANPVGFRATTPVTNVSVNNGASATMLFGTEEVDTNSAYNPATGRFTPNAAGYYSIDWFIVTSANGAGELLATLSKNGTDIAWGTNVVNASAHWNGVGGSAGMIYLNGTTDYINVKLTNNSGSTATVYSGSLSYFSAYLIR